jgi:hypothetical protein
MNSQKISGTTQPDAATDASAFPNTNSPKAGRPVPVTRPIDAADATGAAGTAGPAEAAGVTAKSSKITPRKSVPSKKGKKGKKGVVRRPGENAPVDAKGATGGKGIKRRPKRGARFSRKQFLIGLIILVVIFDIGAMGLWYFSKKSGPAVPPNPDPYSLIQSQMSNNRNIAEVGYDSALSFANYPDLTIVNTASLKPIESNLLMAEGGPDGKDSLYDEQIVGRILKFNSDWVNYLNRSDRTLFDSVQGGSAAEAKAAELGAESMIAYHRLALGEIRHSGKNYYLLTQASYTLTKDGQLDIHEDLFVYKLVAQGSTMLIVDFEQLPVGSLQEQPVDIPIDGAEGVQPGEISGESSGEEPIEATGEGEPPADEQSSEQSSEPDGEPTPQSDEGSIEEQAGEPTG